MLLATESVAKAALAVVVKLHLLTFTLISGPNMVIASERLTARQNTLQLLSYSPF